MTAPNQWGLPAIDILARSNVAEPSAPINCCLSRNENELETAEHPLPGGCQEKQLKGRKDRVERMSNALMLVASLTATMDFHVGVNPPGGVWQDTSQENEHLGLHVAGLLILIILQISSLQHRKFQCFS